MFAWIHKVLYYMEAFEAKMISSVFRGVCSIACSVFKMWSLRLLQGKCKSSTSSIFLRIPGHT